MSRKKRSTGLLLGKFMPPHQGHLHLIEFARAYCTDLTIVVGTLEREPIPANLRFEWMRELASSFANVVHLTDDLPQEPSEHPDFWAIWQATLKRIHPAPIDYVFASEPYGKTLAEVLSAAFVPVDLSRTGVPISGTAIRDNPLEHWAHIPRCVRPYFVKRIVIFGPESTGKSTLAADLAAHWKSIFVPEYARTLLEATVVPTTSTSTASSPVTDAIMEQIVLGQMASEDALAKSAHRFLFLDTDVLTTTIWWNTLLGHCPPWVLEEGRRRTYDLTFLTDIDVPWTADAIRYRPDDRAAFFARCETTLREANRPFVRVRGSREERLQAAIQAINERWPT